MQRLFSLQDRPLTEDKKDFFLDELEKCRYPIGAVIAGIRSLAEDDLKTIKFITLKTAAAKFITHVFDDYKCSNCKGEGVVVFRKSFPYEHDTCLACTCDRGETLAKAHGIVRWNGEAVQMNGEHQMVKR